MTDLPDLAPLRPAAMRSSLSEFASPELTVLRSCEFSYVAKIGTPLDDILVPLLRESALPDLVGRPGVSGVVTTPDLADLVPAELGLAVAADALQAHHAVHLALSRIPGRVWADFASEIDPTAIVHPAAWVAPRNVQIGAGAEIMPFAMVGERSSIGAGSRIHANAVIGGEAYEIVMVDGGQVLRPQTGGVVIGRNCEIMTGSVVTRAAFGGATMIGDRTVLDSGVTISHDTRIGSDVRIGGGSWVGGRVVIGNRVALGPNSTISNGLNIGDHAKVALGSVVTLDIAAGARVAGNFAIAHEKFVEQMRRNR